MDDPVRLRASLEAALDPVPVAVFNLVPPSRARGRQEALHTGGAVFGY
jgi:hypothetical protein